MFHLATPLPSRSPDLTLRPLGDGRYVVKNPRTGDYHQLGTEEHFLLVQLDGNRDAATVCEAFAESFGQSLAEEELEGFLETAREQGLLQPTAESEVRNQESGVGNRESENPSVLTPGQSILYWRRSIFDPDRLFTWLAPKIWFFWTRAFLVLSGGSILFATGLIWANRRQALQEELSRLDKQVVQYRAERDAAQDVHRRSESLRSRDAVSHVDNREAERKLHVADAQLAQAEFEKRRREALGTREAITGLDAEAELARREKDLADARGTLALLQAGSRPEEIEAARAHVDRLSEEFNQLQQQQQKQTVTSPVSGLVTTTHLKEMVGQYLHEGDLICLLEEPTRMAAEIDLKEQDVPRVQPGHAVALKARALPFETLFAKVERIAPAAGAGDVQSTVTIYCRLQNTSDLRPGMTGHARIYTGRRSIMQIGIPLVFRFRWRWTS